MQSWTESWDQNYLNHCIDFCTFMAEANIMKAKTIINPILGLELLPRNKKDNGKERILDWLNLSAKLIIKLENQGFLSKQQSGCYSQAWA